MGIELLSDGAMVAMEPERAHVASLADLFGGQYLSEETGLSLLFPYADALSSAQLLEQQATRRVMGQERNLVRLSFSSNESTQAVFPGRFQLLAVFEAAGAALRVECALGNAGEEPMPAFFGLQVGLRRPVTEGEDEADYLLEREVEDAAAEGIVRLFSRRSGRGTELARGGLALQHAEQAGRLLFAAPAGADGLLAPMQSLRFSLTLSML